MTLSKDVQMIFGALDLLHASCERISGLGGCDRCPIKPNCLEITDALTLAEDVTVRQFDQFLSLSSDMDNYMDEQDWIASEADQARKMEIEERMIDEEWGI